MTTVFVSPEDIERESVELTGDVHHHLFRASRLAAGDPLRVADGEGRARGGVVETVGKTSAWVRLGGDAAANEPAVGVQVLVAAPKKPRAEWLVEKTTELGVRSVRFVHSERGPRSYGRGAFDRFRRIAASAAAQCERAVVPEVTGMHEPEEVTSLIEGSAAYLLDPSAPWFEPNRGAGSISLLIGPEGGWSARELTDLSALGVTQAGLGSRLLRVETAAVIAVSRCVPPD